MNKKNVAIILGIVCMILVTLIFIQMKTIKEATKIVGSTLRDNSGLKDEFLQWQGRYNSLYGSLEDAETRLEQIRQQATINNEGDTQTQTLLKKYNKLMGLTDVYGQGLEIKLDDNRNINIKETLNISDYLVHEGDLLQIINELFNSGADAICINNQRIITSTSILCDGNIIRVNGEMIGVPITIKAIGYPERLYYALMRPQGYLDLMLEDGVIVEVEKREEIFIPKYEGVYSYEYIKGE